MIHYDDVGVGEVVNLGIELYTLIGAETFRFRVGVLATLPPEDPWSQNETWEKGIEAQVWDWLEEMCAERGGDWFERKCGPTLRRSLEPFRQNLSGLVRDTAIGLINAAEAEQQLALLQEQQEPVNPELRKPPVPADTAGGTEPGASAESASPVPGPAEIPAAPPPAQPTPKPEEQAGGKSKTRKKQATVTVDPDWLMRELKVLDSNRKLPQKPLELNNPSKLAIQLAAESPPGGPNKKSWEKMLTGAPVRSDVPEHHLKQFFEETITARSTVFNT
jgi:hypothetical protein